MLELADVEKMFDPKTEKKATPEEQREKHNRRIESIFFYVPEIVQIIVQPKNGGIFHAILTLNNHYKQFLENDEIQMAIEQLRCFIELLKKDDLNIRDKAHIAHSYDFKTYKQLTQRCSFSQLKSFSRLFNMKKIAESLLEGKLSEKIYLEDLNLQIEFFEELLAHYEDISKDNFFVYVLRYDLKTKKKKKPFRFHYPFSF